PQKRPAAHRTYPLDIVKDRTQAGATPEFAIVGDREPMGLVANSHQKKERRRIPGQHDRILSIRQKNALLRLGNFLLHPVVQHVLLRQRDAIDLFDEPLLAQNLERDVELPLASVDYPEVRVVVLAPGPLRPPGQHLRKAGEVILSLEAANPVAAIAVLVRFALVEGYLRTDHHRTLEIGDVVAFNALGRVAQMKPRAQLFEHLLACVLVVAARGETLPRILHRHLQNSQLLTPLREENLHFPAAPLGQQLGPHLEVLERNGKDDFVGNVARTLIELSQEIGEDFLVGELQVLETPALGARKLSAAHDQDDCLDEPALAVQAEDILIDSPVMKDGLTFDGLFNRAHAVADSGCRFEFKARGVRLHLLAHLAKQLEVLALEQQLRRAQMSLVFLAVDWQAARPQASLYLVLKARPRTIAENPVRAGSQGKHLADHVDGLAQSVRRAEGPEISAPILHDPPRDRDPRPRMIGNLGAQVGFVILQPDVVARLVLLDEVVLEVYRLVLAGVHQGVEIPHPPHQETHLEAPVTLIAVATEIRANPRTQRLRLADVQNFPGAVLEQIYAGSGRNIIKPAKQRILVRRKLERRRLRRGSFRILDQRSVPRHRNRHRARVFP